MGERFPNVADEPIVFDDDTRRKFLETLALDPWGIGQVQLMRDLGVVGTKAQIKAAIAEQLRADIDEIRHDEIHTEIRRRAVEGTVEEVFGSLGAGAGTGVVGERRVYSDRLLELAARLWLPEGRERLEVTGEGGGPIQIEGKAVVGLADVLELARQLGVGAAVGLDAGAARGALPAASDVLPDPSAG